MDPDQDRLPSDHSDHQEPPPLVTLQEKLDAYYGMWQRSELARSAAEARVQDLEWELAGLKLDAIIARGDTDGG